MLRTAIILSYLCNSITRWGHDRPTIVNLSHSEDKVSKCRDFPKCDTPMSTLKNNCSLSKTY